MKDLDKNLHQLSKHIHRHPRLPGPAQCSGSGEGCSSPPVTAALTGRRTQNCVVPVVALCSQDQVFAQWDPHLPPPRTFLVIGGPSLTISKLVRPVSDAGPLECGNRYLCCLQLRSLVRYLLEQSQGAKAPPAPEQTSGAAFWVSSLRASKCTGLEAPPEETSSSPSRARQDAR